MAEQQTIYDVLFDKDRELLKEEYANLRTKQKDGFMNANFFRRNMFNATSRGKRLQYQRPKVVWQQSKNKKVAVSHSLHQRHADVLSLIHSDNIGITKPKKDGSYDIYLSLYRLAKLMGYKDPHKRTDDVKQFINDLRWTDFVVTTKDGEYRNTILGRAYFDEFKDKFIVKVDGDSAKILAHTTGIKFGRDITHRIVSIPNKLPKLKALVRYVISSKPTSNGYTMEHIFERFGIGQTGSEQTKRNQKSDFRKQLIDNEDLLNSFNIIYHRDNQKIYYTEQLGEVRFELSLDTGKILKKVNLEESYKDFIGKQIKIENIIYTIRNVTPLGDGKADIELFNEITKQIGTSKNASLDNLRGYINNYENEFLETLQGKNIYIQNINETITIGLIEKHINLNQKSCYLVYDKYDNIGYEIETIEEVQAMILKADKY